MSVWSGRRKRDEWCDCFCIKQLEYDYHYDEWLGGQGPCRHGRCGFAVLTKKETVVYINCNGF